MCYDMYHSEIPIVSEIPIIYGNVIIRLCTVDNMNACAKLRSQASIAICLQQWLVAIASSMRGSNNHKLSKSPHYSLLILLFLLSPYNILSTS